MAYCPGGSHQSVPDSRIPRLSGTGRVADDLHLIAHHQITGRPYLSPRPLGAGIAGGLLAELIAAGAVTLKRGYVLPLRPRAGVPGRTATVGDPVASHVLDLVSLEDPPLPARDWLLFLGKASAAAVAGRLEASGYLTRPARRVPWQAPRPVASNVNWPQCALLRAHAALDAARPLTLYSAVLAGLTLACGLGFRLSGLSDGPRRTVAEATQDLPLPLQELIAHLQMTADNTVLSARK